MLIAEDRRADEALRETLLRRLTPARVQPAPRWRSFAGSCHGTGGDGDASVGKMTETT